MVKNSCNVSNMFYLYIVYLQIHSPMGTVYCNMYIVYAYYTRAEKGRQDKKKRTFYKFFTTLTLKS